MIFNKMTDQVSVIMERIFAQNFNQELAQGSLPIDKFIYYLEQDALYLADFSKALALTAARLSEHTHCQQFLQFAISAIQSERSLHTTYLRQYNRKLRAEKNPICFSYTNYLLQMATLASVEETVASLLPCFWVYGEVGKTVAAATLPNNPYQDWIVLYSSVDFAASVAAAIQITNELSMTAPKSLRDKMVAAFVKATQLEWQFWESAYAQEEWPI